MPTQTSNTSAHSPSDRHDRLMLPLDPLSEWQQDQFKRHLHYARSLGLSPDHALRFARQQLRAAEAVHPQPPTGPTPQ